MTVIDLPPLQTDPDAWLGSEMKSRQDWIDSKLGPAQIAEKLEAAYGRSAYVAASEAF